MLTASSAPPSACTASGPSGLQMSSQMLIPTLTPPMTYSSSAVGLVARREVAGLVEHRVVRQQTLAVGAEHAAVGADRRGVEQVEVGVDEAEHRRAPTGVPGEPHERRLGVGDEPGLEHEILRRVAGDRQLGERDDVAAGGLGEVVGVQDLGDVAVEVPDGGVELGERDSENRHHRRRYWRRRPAIPCGPASAPQPTLPSPGKALDFR